MAARQDELRDFLRSRRARLSPAEVGLPVNGSGRRVAGLRREELAMLAGVSADYYARLEQGRATNVSDQVLTAVADALHLDDVERRYFTTLVKGPGSSSTPPTIRVRPALRSMINALGPVPAMLHGPLFEVLAVNRAARLLIDDFDAMPTADRNMAKWMFLNPKARDVYPDWDEIAAQLVAVIRAAGAGEAGSRLAELCAELGRRSAEFARFWAEHRVFRHTHGPKRFRHPAVGIMTLNYEALQLPDDPGLTLILYSADVGSPSEAKLHEMLAQ
ncbi:transcriptional regulator [Mycolicibacterium agri]|uniref:Transcriptional regulator n=1 Tax=Mycolicibacterium agri TaxID=36811 RepID=A0A2A7MXU2_MYCAG|nr:helix-turn-helix transcriptional regulator [Mycolicibacterium agri]PEG36496.1 transcriptional regulator [Mycolicibacterium agri]GFG49569.1 transcriptional regulator [Mycolicibacterium agri]